MLQLGEHLIGRSVFQKNNKKKLFLYTNRKNKRIFYVKKCRNDTRYYNQTYFFSCFACCTFKKNCLACNDRRIIEGKAILNDYL